MTIREAVRDGAALLREKGSESPFLDASLLAALALSIDSTSLLARYPEAFPDDGGRYAGLLARRASGEPFAYLSGRKEFRSLDFEVDHSVLIPRPDTELLVESALRAVSAILAARPAGSRPAPLAFHDCCTGSGCVAVSLFRELAALYPDIPFRATMSDISEEALAVASRNAFRLLGRGLDAERRDLLSGCADASLDLVTANPPYLTAAELETVRARNQGEPEAALYGGPDGLDLYRALLPQAMACLAPGGCLLVEIGSGQGEALLAMLGSAGFSGAFVDRDLAGLDRVAGGWKRG